MLPGYSTGRHSPGGRTGGPEGAGPPGCQAGAVGRPRARGVPVSATGDGEPGGHPGRVSSSWASGVGGCAGVCQRLGGDRPALARSESRGRAAPDDTGARRGCVVGTSQTSDACRARPRRQTREFDAFRRCVSRNVSRTPQI
jgi:hypothetical protein